MNGIIQILYLLRVHGSFIPPHGTSCHPCRGTQWMRARDLPKHQSSVAIAGAFMLDTLRYIRGIQLQLMTTNRDDHSTLELNAISRMYTRRVQSFHSRSRGWPLSRIPSLSASNGNTNMVRYANRMAGLSAASVQPSE